MAIKKKPKAKNTKKTKKKTSAPKTARKAAARKPAPKKVAPKKSAKAKSTAAPKTAPAPTPTPVAPRPVAPTPVAPRPVVATPTAPTPAAPTAVTPPPGERIGTVTHYYSHLSVAIIELDTGSLRVGDVVHIKGHTSDFQQRVESMEIDRVNVNEAGPGESLGLRVKQHAREHDIVYKVTR
jgi:putative protease